MENEYSEDESKLSQAQLSLITQRCSKFEAIIDRQTGYNLSHKLLYSWDSTTTL
jgi:hypothetical protein